MAEYIEQERQEGSLRNVRSKHNIAEKLEAIPAADVRPVVHGHWIKRFYYRPSTRSYDIEMHCCSECHEEYSYDAETGISAIDFKFCPNCNAMMDRRTETDGCNQDNGEAEEL